MAHFDVEQIPSSPEKQRTRKFLSQFGDDYLGKMEKDEIIQPIEILRAVFAVREKLPISPRGTGDASATSVQTHYGNF